MAVRFAISLSNLRPTETCVVVEDETGGLFVHAPDDEEAAEVLRRMGDVE